MLPSDCLKLAFLAGLMAGAASCSSPQKKRPEWGFEIPPPKNAEKLQPSQALNWSRLRHSSKTPLKNRERSGRADRFPLYHGYHGAGWGKAASGRAEAFDSSDSFALYNAGLDEAGREGIGRGGAGWRGWRNFKSRPAGRQQGKGGRLSAFPPTAAAAPAPQKRARSRSAYPFAGDENGRPLSAPGSKNQKRPRAAARGQAEKGSQKAAARGGRSGPADNKPPSENSRSAGKMPRRSLAAEPGSRKNQASRKAKPSAKAAAGGKQKKAGEAGAPMARDPFARPDFLSLTAVEIPPRAALKKSPPALAKPFPFIKNGEVERWIWFFSRAGGPGYTKLWLKRAYRYIPLMKGILRSHGLPEELAYMTLVESSLSPRAVSSARAVGYWQFIKPTALRFGLQINSHVDERMDFQKSANAAARYLRQLQVEFQDWLLAMSAYNMGEARLRKLIKRHEERNFWNLARKPDFPKETSLYIPKILAAVHIMKAPSLYGFQGFSILTPHKYDIFYVPGGTNVKKMFREANLSIKSLRALNPELKGAAAPKFPPLYKLRIPKGSGESVSNWLKGKKGPKKTSSAKKSR